MIGGVGTPFDIIFEREFGLSVARYSAPFAVDI
jgi:hypothetical protein